LLEAGPFLIMGMSASWVLLLRQPSAKPWTLWAAWLLVLCTLAYTSGVAWVSNHLGPAVMIGTSWFCVALVRLWPTVELKEAPPAALARHLIAVGMFVSLFGSLGLVREPHNAVPASVNRYISEIESEFKEGDPATILLDTGSWIYFREGIVMKDRSDAVALHAGKNQPEIRRSMLAETIQRIEARTYDKILARQIDTDQSPYDFQDRGTGVKGAILGNYRAVRRIDGVSGVRRWWPLGLLSEVVVLEPKPDERTALCPGGAEQGNRAVLSDSLRPAQQRSEGQKAR
jgi:hypothetical protein